MALSSRCIFLAITGVTAAAAAGLTTDIPDVEQGRGTFLSTAASPGALQQPLLAPAEGDEPLTANGFPANYTEFTAAMANCLDTKVFSSDIQTSVFKKIDELLHDAKQAEAIGIQSPEDREVVEEMGYAFKNMMTDARKHFKDHMVAATVAKINGYSWTLLSLAVCGSAAYGGLAPDSYFKLNDFLFFSDNILYMVAGLLSITGQSLHNIVKRYAPAQIFRKNPGATRWFLTGLLNMFAPVLLWEKEDGEGVSGVLAGILAATTFLHVQDLLHSAVLAANGVSAFQHDMDHGMEDVIKKLDPEMQDLINNVAKAKQEQEQQKQPRSLIRVLSSSFTSDTRGSRRSWCPCRARRGARWCPSWLPLPWGSSSSERHAAAACEEGQERSNDEVASELIRISVKAAKAKKTKDTAEPTEAPTDAELLTFQELAMVFKKPPMDQAKADMINEAITAPVLYVASFLPSLIGLCLGYGAGWSALFGRKCKQVFSLLLWSLCIGPADIGIGGHQLYFALSLYRDSDKDVFDVFDRPMDHHGSTQGLVPKNAPRLAKLLILGQVALMGVPVARLSKAVIVQKALSGMSPSEVMSSIRSTDVLVLAAMPFISKALAKVAVRVARPLVTTFLRVGRTAIPLEHISVRLVALNLCASLAFSMSMIVHYAEYRRLKSLPGHNNENEFEHPVFMAALGFGNSPAATARLHLAHRIPRRGPLTLAVRGGKNWSMTNNMTNIGTNEMRFDDSWSSVGDELLTEWVQESGFIGLLGAYISVVYTVFEGNPASVAATQMLQIVVSVLALMIAPMPDDASADTVLRWEEFYSMCFGLGAVAGLVGQFGYLRATVEQYRRTPVEQTMEQNVVDAEGGLGLDQATMDWMK